MSQNLRAVLVKCVLTTAMLSATPAGQTGVSGELSALVVGPDTVVLGLPCILKVSIRNETFPPRTKVGEKPDAASRTKAIEAALIERRTFPVCTPLTDRPTARLSVDGHPAVKPTVRDFYTGSITDRELSSRGMVPHISLSPGDTADMAVDVGAELCSLAAGAHRANVYLFRDPSVRIACKSNIWTFTAVLLTETDRSVLCAREDYAVGLCAEEPCVDSRDFVSALGRSRPDIGLGALSSPAAAQLSLPMLIYDLACGSRRIDKELATSVPSHLALVVAFCDYEVRAGGGDSADARRILPTAKGSEWYPRAVADGNGIVARARELIQPEALELREFLDRKMGHIQTGSEE